MVSWTQNDCKIQAVSSVHVLGITSNNKLNFILYIDKFCPKSAKQLLKFRTKFYWKEKENQVRHCVKSAHIRSHSGPNAGKYGPE